jgi:hypothetical protein
MMINFKEKKYEITNPVYKRLSHGTKEIKSDEVKRARTFK